MAKSNKKSSSRPDRTAEILAAADELFGERGYDAVSMRDVATRAGLGKALAFYYFNSKEELFERVLARYNRAHEEALEAAFDDDGPLRERFHRLIDAYVDFIAEHRRFPRLVQQQVASRGGDVGVIGESLGRLQEFTERALGDLAPRMGPTSARHLFVTFSGAVINYFTYAGALSAIWDGDPLAEAALAERRAHIHWLADVVMDRLEADRG